MSRVNHFWRLAVVFAFLVVACGLSSCHARILRGEGGVLRSAFSAHSDTIHYKTMDKSIEKLYSLFTEMVANSNSFGDGWKNLKLGREAFEEMRRLPLRVKGELTPYTRIVLLNKMLECMPERDCARFVLEVREYQETMFPLVSEDDLGEDMDMDCYEGEVGDYKRVMTEEMLRQTKQKTVDYLNPKVTMEEWCKRYGQHLRFDNVERSERWEREIYDVEKEVAEELEDSPVRMGYCHEYWSAKRAALARHGIEWSSPSMMNPGVMFD